MLGDVGEMFPFTDWSDDDLSTMDTNEDMRFKGLDLNLLVATRCTDDQTKRLPQRTQHQPQSTGNEARPSLAYAPISRTSF